LFDLSKEFDKTKDAQQKVSEQAKHVEIVELSVASVDSARHDSALQSHREVGVWFGPYAPVGSLHE